MKAELRRDEMGNRLVLEPETEADDLFLELLYQCGSEAHGGAKQENGKWSQLGLRPAAVRPAIWGRSIAPDLLREIGENQNRVTGGPSAAERRVTGWQPPGRRHDIRRA